MIPTIKNKALVSGGLGCACVVGALSGEIVNSDFSICPFRFATGYYCPLCGMTRAIYSFFTFNFSYAVQYNWLVFPLLIAIFCWLFFTKFYYKTKESVLDKIKKINWIKFTTYSFFVLILIFNWVLRNIHSTGLDYFAKR